MENGNGKASSVCEIQFGLVFGVCIFFNWLQKEKRKNWNR